MTITMRLTTGHELTGDSVADILAAEWGPRARLNPSADPNDLRYGQVLEASEYGGYRVLATVAWIDPEPGDDTSDRPDRLDRLTAIRQAARYADSAQQALAQAVRDAHAAGVPIAAIADAAQVTRQTIYRWIKS